MNYITIEEAGMLTVQCENCEITPQSLTVLNNGILNIVNEVLAVLLQPIMSLELSEQIEGILRGKYSQEYLDVIIGNFESPVVFKKRLEQREKTYGEKNLI